MFHWLESFSSYIKDFDRRISHTYLGIAPKRRLHKLRTMAQEIHGESFTAPAPTERLYLTVAVHRLLSFSSNFFFQFLMRRKFQKCVLASSRSAFLLLRSVRSVLKF